MMNKRSFLGNDPVFLQADRFSLELMDEKFKTVFLESMEPKSKNPVQDRQIRETVWDMLNGENCITFSILSPQHKQYMGYCQYKNIRLPRPDIGIVLMPEYRGQGLGYDVCRELITRFFDKTSHPSIDYRVERQNTVSIKLIEKLGGKRDSTYHTHEQLLSSLNSMTQKEIAEFGKDPTPLIKSLIEHDETLKREVLPTDIFIYRIARTNWN